MLLGNVLSRTIAQSKIRENLDLLETRFNESMSSTRLKQGSILAALFSKLAILEVCGWLEQTIDSIMYYYVNNTVNNRQIRELIKEQVIDTVYGFTYGRDLKPLMMKLLGAKQFHYIELRLQKKGLDQILFTCINQLNKERNVAAHTYWREASQQRFDAPSVTRQVFNQLLPIVLEINTCVKRLANKRNQAAHKKQNRT